VTYAANSSVPVARSRAELQQVLERAKCTSAMVGESGGEAMVAFELQGRVVKMRWPIPKRDADAFVYKQPTGAEKNRMWWRKNAPGVADKLHAQAVRSAWRVLILIVKAKLEVIEAGLSTVEREFLADLLLPGGQTVHDAMRENIALVYDTNQVPMLGSGR
jgi:hypothetical protein